MAQNTRDLATDAGKVNPTSAFARAFIRRMCDRHGITVEQARAIYLRAMQRKLLRPMRLI